MSRALEKTETGNSKEQPDANQEGILAVTFATLTRTAIFTLKGLPKGIMKSVLKKRAFLFIGKRTVTATMSPSVKASKKVHSSRVSDLIRTCLMGLSVFGVYDWIIHRAESNQKDKSENDNPATSPKPKTILTADLKLVWMHASVRPDKPLTPLLAHFSAGALSGLAQSIVLDGWEIIVHRYYGALYTVPQRYLFRLAIHNAAGYASLFGCYELFRRCLTHFVYSYYESGHESVPRTLDTMRRYGLISFQDNCYDMSVVPLATAFFAGGFAGKVHHVVNHYSRYWKLMAKRREATMNRRLLPRPPSFRATLSAFLPTGVCFLAFQYGTEFYDQLLDEKMEQNPFPVYIVR